MTGIEKREQNLKPFSKGDPRAKLSPGRPRHQPMSEYFREWLSDPKNRASITKRLIKLKPDVVLHYAEGKPVETQVQLTGEMAGKELEIQVARVLAAGGVSNPQPALKDAP